MTATSFTAMRPWLVMVMGTSSCSLQPRVRRSTTDGSTVTTGAGTLVSKVAVTVMSYWSVTVVGTTVQVYVTSWRAMNACTSDDVPDGIWTAPLNGLCLSAVTLRLYGPAVIPWNANVPSAPVVPVATVALLDGSSRVTVAPA